MLQLVLFVSWASFARAHGIAGNRYFPGTLTFDDPSVAAEAYLPIYSRYEHPTPQGGDATDDALTSSFGQLLTPTLEIGADTTWINRKRVGFSARSGFSSIHAG